MVSQKQLPETSSLLPNTSRYGVFTRRYWILGVFGGVSLLLRRGKEVCGKEKKFITLGFQNKVSDNDIGKQMFALGFLLYHLASVGMRTMEFSNPILGLAIHGVLQKIMPHL